MDNTREFRVLIPWGIEKGIEFEFIEAHTSPQNSVAERFNQIILQIVRALLFDTKISKIYWKYTVITANYLRNRTTPMKNSVDENGWDRMLYELWHSHQPDLSYLRAWGCWVLYHDSMVESKLDSYVAKGMFMLYGESNKQYYVMPQGCNRINDLKLVMNPEFCEWEDGYCEKVPANPPLVATAQIEPTQPMADIEKCQPVPMPTPAPSMVPGPTERERGNELSWEMRTEPVPSRVNEGAVSEKGVELTPTDD